MTTVAQDQGSLELEDFSGSERGSHDQLLTGNEGKASKPLSFYLTFAALNICVLLVSLDATALAVAVPVSSGILSHFESLNSPV